jgi:hypothetical protein
MNIAWRAARVTDSQALAGEFADHRELDRRTESLTVNVHGPFVLRRTSQAARSYRVLEDCCSLFAGFFLYYPSRRQQPAALSAPIDTLRLEDRRK